MLSIPDTRYTNAVVDTDGKLSDSDSSSSSSTRRMHNQQMHAQVHHQLNATRCGNSNTAPSLSTKTATNTPTNTPPNWYAPVRAKVDQVQKPDSQNDTIKQSQQQIPTIINEECSVAQRYLTNYPLNPSFTSQYLLGDELGSGGFGFVVSVHRRIDYREFAVKFIFKAKVSPQHWVRDIQLGLVPMEVFLLKNVRHANVVEFVDCFEDVNYVYLVMGIHGKSWSSSGEKEKEKDENEKNNRELIGCSSTTVSASASTSSSPTKTTTKPLSLDLTKLSQKLIISENPTDTLTPPHTPDFESSSPFIFSQHPQPHTPIIRRRNSQDLFEAIELHRRFPEQHTRYIFAQIISAFTYLHDHGIVHRDIKDENILLDEDWRVRIIDFGSAGLVPVCLGNNSTQQVPGPLPGGCGPDGLFDKFYGTVQYASPEILVGSKYEGRAADVWALGCLLYVTLQGEIPFLGPREAIQGVLRPLKVPMSPECVDLLRGMFCVDPRRRLTIHQVWRHPWIRNACSGRS